MFLRTFAPLGFVLAMTSVLLAGPISIVANYLDGADEGFNDATLGTARRAALEFAMNIWGNTLEAAYVGETITMDVRFEPLGGSANSATLGFARAEGAGFVAGNPQGNNVFFSAGIRNHLSGSDVTTGSEMLGTFNSSVDGNTVLGSTTFYYGTDGMGGAGTVDFVEVALHEIGHGLGFGGTLIPQTAGGAFISDQTQLINNEGTQASYLNGNLINSFDNQIVRKNDLAALDGLSSTERYDAVINDNIAWNGANGMAANGGNPIDMEGTYSSDFGGIPAGTWILGSTYSHVDEDDYPLELMSPLATAGTGFEIDPFTRGMLQDIGWTLSAATAIPEPSTFAALFVGGCIGVWRRRRIPSTTT